MRLNIRQVEAFRGVMLTGSMTGAAEMLGVTQPAVSRLVRDFEGALGLRLFERRGAVIAPTAAAATLLGEVERSYDGLARIADLAGAIRRGAAGSLRIAALPALATGALPRFVARFVASRPELRVAVLGMPSHLVVEAVAAGGADAGYAMGPLERPGFRVDAVPARAVAAVPERHRLAGARVVTAGSLAGERLVGIASGSLFRARLDAALAGIPKPALLEAALTHTACALVAEGAGVAIVDPFTAAEFAGRGLVVRPFSPAIEVGLVRLRPPARPSSALLNTFLDGLADHLTGIAAPLRAPAG